MYMTSYMTDGLRGLPRWSVEEKMPTVWAIQFEAGLSFFGFSASEISKQRCFP